MGYRKEDFAYSYTEIAQKLNLTRNQVIAIERRAMKKIIEIVDRTDKLKEHSIDMSIFNDKYTKKV